MRLPQGRYCGETNGYPTWTTTDITDDGLADFVLTRDR